MVFIQSSAKKVLDQLQFYNFIRSIPKQSFRNYERLKQELLTVRGEPSERSSSPIVKRGIDLRNQAISEYKDCLRSSCQLRILIHRPDVNLSPGGYSLFSNLAHSLEFIGVQARTFESDRDFDLVLEEFEPNVLLSSDHPSYLQMIDWKKLQRFRKHKKLLLGLTASLEEYGNSPLAPRLEWGKEHGINFYYSFRSQKYVRERSEYEPFHRAKFPILTVEFGANPMIHYPTFHLGPKEFDYVFLASINRDKWQQYFAYLPRIVKSHVGVISGPGWQRRWGSGQGSFDFSRDRYIYSRCKVGLNLHIRDSLDWACELNERTYILAAVGIPQLVDNAKLLKEHFRPNSLFIASNPDEYYELFRHILRNEDVATQYALQAMEDVFARHTTFQRAKDFARELENLFDCGVGSVHWTDGTAHG